MTTNLSLARIALVMCILSLFASTVYANLILDQSNLPDTYSTGTAVQEYYSGQSFTVGITGTLSRIDGLITRSETADSNLELVLAKLDNNNIVTQLFGSVFVDYLDIPIYGTSGCCGGGLTESYYSPYMTEIDVSSLNIQVQANEAYVFLYHSTLPWDLDLNNDGFVDDGAKRIDWFAATPATYQDGHPSFRYDASTWETSSLGLEWVHPNFVEDYDLIFKTYVETPEPTTLALLGLGLFGLGFSRRKKLH